ncbi:MAG TPA: POT family MFS transporter [Candidatus Sulfopaludibacter sp.]|nr:POT family MFS transporter [Candidatus Sulfopaludibacter sp.]
MAKKQYLTAPLRTDKLPPGIPYIIGNEAAERFSYYGMNSILVIFMTQYLMNTQGQPERMTDAQADAWYHTFVSVTYFLPIFGAFLADALLGKYLVVLFLSVVYCTGHFTLAMDDTRLGLVIGLGLIALGAGGIKPCVSANVGDQFGATNQRLLPRVFNWFYFAINFGSVFSTILIPELLNRVGPGIAFGVPGIAMVAATVVFWMGRRKFVHIPPAGLSNYARELLQRENFKALLNLLVLVPFAAMFWALWQQNFSSWVIQAQKMDRHLFGYNLLPAQIQTANPIFILILLPLFSYIIYPAAARLVKVTPLRRFGAGLWAGCAAFVIVDWIQLRIDAGQHPHILWQILAFVVLTAGEVMLSVTHLEFAYTQAPKKMKSLVMCTYLGSISLGNAFAAAVNFFIQNPDGSVKLEGAAYFQFFVVVMLVTALLFLLVGQLYRGKTYIQDEAEPWPAVSSPKT